MLHICRKSAINFKLFDLLFPCPWTCKPREKISILSNRPGARFSKVPIINGPGKLSPFTLKIEVSIVLHLT